MLRYSRQGEDGQGAAGFHWVGYLILSDCGVGVGGR